MAQSIAQPEATHWNARSFWQKLRRYAASAGRPVVERALWLYYAARRPDSPVWAKATVYGALGYFISMVDAIPDLTPVLGYTDDLALMALALTTLAAYVDEGVKQRTAAVMARLFPAE